MSARHELGTLEASGLVQVAALEPELEYLFRHALVQDAAYSSLLKQDRRTLHRLAADTLLTLYPERQRELAAVIALPLERAGDPAAAAGERDRVAAALQSAFREGSIVTGFDLPEGNLHSPNERFLVEHIPLGVAAAQELFTSLAGLR